MRCIIFAFLACSLAAPADRSFSTERTDPAAAGMNREMLARIHARMQEFVDAGKTAGVVTLITRHGVVAHFDAVGFQDLERKIPMKTGTIFRVMSITTPVTCAGIMTLVDEGRLSLLDPVEKFVPESGDPQGLRARYDLWVARRAMELLERAYPGHPWLVEADSAKGVVTISQNGPANSPNAASAPGQQNGTPTSPAVGGGAAPGIAPTT